MCKYQILSSDKKMYNNHNSSDKKMYNNHNSSDKKMYNNHNSSDKKMYNNHNSRFIQDQDICTTLKVHVQHWRYMYSRCTVKYKSNWIQCCLPKQLNTVLSS
jgi:hypothetical protein